MKTAKKAALGALAATVMALVTPMTSASADPGDTVSGGCGFNTDENATATNGQNEGVIYDLSATQHADHTPSGATVQCWIDVNGVEAGGTRISASGTGVQANAANISFSATDTDIITECELVTFDDGSTPFGPDCPGATTLQIPPQQIIDALNTVIDTLNGVLISTVDPVVCPVLVQVGQAIGGGVSGVLEIRADGDVYVADPLGLGINPVYDCPPYGNF